MKITKRILAMVLSLVMVASLMPNNLSLVTKVVKAASGNIQLGTETWDSETSKTSYKFEDVSANFEGAYQKIFCISVDTYGYFLAPNGFSLGTGSTVTGLELVSSGTGYESKYLANTEVVGGDSQKLTSLSVISSQISEAEIVAFIKSLTFYRNGVNDDVKQTVSVVASASELPDDSAAMAIDGTLHYYKYVKYASDDKTSTWEDAYKAAKDSTFLGMKGYLATITSDLEMQYLYHSLGSELKAWIGGARTNESTIVYDSDEIKNADLCPTVDGTKDGEKVRDWRWVCGPEAGRVFYRTSVEGNYANWYPEESGKNADDLGLYQHWDSGEPNNTKPGWGADYKQIDESLRYNQEYALEYGYQAERWNDFNPHVVDRSYAVKGYIVEYSPYKLTASDHTNGTESVPNEEAFTSTEIISLTKPILKANDFLLTSDEAKALTGALAKTNADVSVKIGSTTEDSTSTNIQVNFTNLSNIKNGKPGEYPLGFTYTKDETTASTSVKVNIADRVVPTTAGEGGTKVSLGANAISLKLSDIVSLTDAQLLDKLVEAGAPVVIADGKKTDDAVTTTTTIEKKAGEYTATFTYKGVSVTVPVTVTNDLSTVDAKDFTVPANKDSNLTKDEVIALAEAKVSDSNVKPTISDEDLKKINDAAKNGSTTPVTITITAEGYNPVEVTVSVQPENKKVISASDFVVKPGSGELKPADVISKANASVEGSTEVPSVNTSDLDKLNEAITNSTPGNYQVRLTFPNADTKTITVTVSEKAVITANDFDVEKESAKLTVDDVLNYSNASISDDSSAKPIVNPADLDALNKAIQDGTKGTYPVKLTYSGADTKTIQVTVTDKPTITGNDFEVMQGQNPIDGKHDHDGVFEPFTAEDIIQLGNIVAKDRYGNVVTPEISQTDLDKLNRAMEDGSEEPVSVTIKNSTATPLVLKVTVKPVAFTPPNILEAYNFVISLSEASSITEDTVKKLAKATFYLTESDWNSKTGNADAVSVDASSLTALTGMTTPGELYVKFNATGKNEYGTDIPIEYSVKAIVVDDRNYGDPSDGTVDPGDDPLSATVYLGANDFCISITQAKSYLQTPNQKDSQDLLKILANAVCRVQTTEGTKWYGSTNAKITFTTNLEAKKGDYDITFKYVDSTTKKETIVTSTVTVKDNASTDDSKDEFVVPKINLTANDFTVKAGSSEITASQFVQKTYADVVAKNNDGSPVTEEVVVDAADLLKLNTQIKSGITAKIPVKLTAGTEVTTVTVTVSGKSAINPGGSVLDDLANSLGVDKETAQQIIDYAEKNGISLDTIKISDKLVLNTNHDKDLKGSDFSKLKARATKSTTKSITVKWKKQSRADGYIIYGNECNHGGKKYKYKKLKVIKGNKKFSYTTKKVAGKKIKKGKYYKFMVIAYKNIKNRQGKVTKMTIAAAPTLHSATKKGKYTMAKSVTITKIGKKKKTTKITLKKGKTAKITAKENKADKKLKLMKHRPISYQSSNTKIATVGKKGKIKAKKKGKCKIWVYAQNGVYKTITVTVK